MKNLKQRKQHAFVVSIRTSAPITSSEARLGLRAALAGARVIVTRPPTLRGIPTAVDINSASVSSIRES